MKKALEEKLSKRVNLFIQLPGESESELLRDFMVLLFDQSSLAKKPPEQDDDSDGADEHL